MQTRKRFLERGDRRLASVLGGQDGPYERGARADSAQDERVIDSVCFLRQRHR